jgi:hypothetical protein
MPLPLLPRNVQRRYRKLTHSIGGAKQELHCAVNEVLSIARAEGTEVGAIVDVAAIHKAPFLKRNLRFPQVSRTSSRREAMVGTKRKKVIADSLNTRRQYRVHCIKHENNAKIPKFTVTTSFLWPAYQCPFCISYEGVRDEVQQLP